MAIELADLREILLSLREVEECVGGNLLILGSAEVHVSADEYKALVAETGFLSHSFPDKLTPFSLGEALGFKLTETLDINGEATITHDLMLPTPASLCDKYHMIIDAGVLFWCFNPGLALNNIYSMLRLDGIAVHITAVSGFYGRGYYNIHPKLLDDFYRLNGCRYIRGIFRQRQISISRWDRVKRRIFLIFGYHTTPRFIDPPDKFGFVNLSFLAGEGYTFGESGNDLLSPIFIPNDVIGALIFQKGLHPTLVEPALI